MKINCVQLIVITFKYYLLNYYVAKGKSNFNEKQFRNLLPICKDFLSIFLKVQLFFLFISLLIINRVIRGYSRSTFSSFSSLWFKCCFEAPKILQS